MKTKRKVYYVALNRNKAERSVLPWAVSIDGADFALFPTKTKAIAYGRFVAQLCRVGQLRIKGRDGRIQTEHTYGADPVKYKG